MREILIDDYVITADRNKMNFADVHQWLSKEAYWCRNMPEHITRKAFDNSFVVAAVLSGRTVGFARLVTDYATFAYLADVFVYEEHRGKGLSKAIMELIMEPDWVQGIRRMMLSTRDAHGLYEQYGFIPLRYPERLMEITRPDIYGDTDNPC